MSTKISELTSKIYEEGIAKANKEADVIIAEAQKRADQIIQDASNEAERIRKEAEHAADDKMKLAEAEIHIVSRQALNNLKQNITRLITTRQVQPALNHTFSNGEFIAEMVATLIKKWNPQHPEEMDVKVLLPKKQEAELQDYFKSKAFSALNEGVALKFAPEIKNGFKIGPKDGRYVISFSDRDFEEYFKSFLKDKTKALLFSDSAETE